MILKLKNKTEYIISNSQAKAVEELLMQNKDIIKIDGVVTFARGLFGTIETGGLKETVDYIFGTDKQLTESSCTTARSIQLEIHNRLLATYPDDWFKRVGDQNQREEMRQAILAEGEKWCDYNTGSCVCGEVAAV